MSDHTDACQRATRIATRPRRDQRLNVEDHEWLRRARGDCPACRESKVGSDADCSECRGTGDMIIPNPDNIDKDIRVDCQKCSGTRCA